MPTTVFLSLGSNLGDRLAYLTRAIELLGKSDQVVALSSIYETAAWGKTDQADFLNLVVKLRTERTPQELLSRLHEIEASLERVRLERWGPRTIDIDILLYGDQQLDEPTLQIPHPRMWERAFVLVPLLELEPDLQVGSRNLRDVLADVKDQTVIRYEADQTDCE